MSFFEDASLVLIPSGYKASKVYSVKPTDGTGDLSFTRALDTATRVGPDGLIEKVRTNVITYSQDFGDASYQITELTRTGGQTDPNGGTTASLFTGVAATNAFLQKDFATTSGTIFTISFFVKGVTSGSVSLRVGAASAQNDINYTTSFQRFTYTFTATGSTSSVFFGGYTTWTGTEGIILAFAQSETGDIATPYIPTTTAAVSVGMLANVPRLDYLGGGCPKLLLEPQRTNIKTSSENATGWGNPISITTALNVATSPDGFVNADKIIETATGGNHRFDVDFSATSGTAFTFSFFAKAAERTQCHIHGYADNLVFGGQTAIFNLLNGTIVSNTGGGIASIVEYANGYYRVSLTLTAGATATGFFGFGVALNGATNYLGVATNGALFYGIQLEVGSYPTSYIPTLGAAVTRGADAATTASVPSLIGQTEGTMFIEFNRTNIFENAFFMLSNLVGTTPNAYQNSFYFLQQPNGTMVVEVYVAAVPQVLLSVAALSVGTHKIALAYKANDFALYVDGVQIGTDTSGSVPTANFLSIGGAVDGGLQKQAVSQALLFKTRLTNAQLAELTA